MSKPILITCQPDDQYFIWQNHLYIESCLEQGFEQEQIHILLYKPLGRQYNKNWENLKKHYPNINIFLYEDKGVQKYLNIYIPILRPHILWQHFEKFPELENKTIIYTDCDILWTKGLDIEKFFNDEICYVSDASSYMNYSYFVSKEKQVIPKMLEEYRKEDVVQKLCDIVGISKQTIIDNNNNTGGVQYILKNINSNFWKKVEKDTLIIRSYLMSINKKFYTSENSGWQSWCADLWGVQFNLWFFKKETKVVKELDFAWASDVIGKLDTCSIFHNAGITGNDMGSYPAFYKGLYHVGKDPFDDPHLLTVYNSEEAKKRCTHYYVTKLLELKNKYNLKY